MLQEINGLSSDGIWYNSAYIYILQNKLHITLNNYHKTIAFIPSTYSILNYLANQNILYCCDRKVRRE